MKRRSRTSMRFSHLTLAMPYQPGAMSRSGEPLRRRQGRAVHLVAEQVVGAHGIGERHAAGEVLLHGHVADLVVKLDVAGSVPQKTTSMPSSWTPASSRSGASGVPAQRALPTAPVKTGKP